MKNTRKLLYAAFMTAVIVVCSWISIPSAVPFTLQTFAVFCCFGLIGTAWGLSSVAAYILLGAFGLPVFSGFVGGVGHLFGPTGGYIIGFLFSGLLYGAVKKLCSDRKYTEFLAMLAGLAVCYLFGTLWFAEVYSGKNGASLLYAFSVCVVPFIIPDIIKIIVACRVVKRVKPYINK